MPRGGSRSGAGRKPGAISRLSREAVTKAKATGELPHEFLLRVARGETIGSETPDLQMRLSAANAAAPYFAPKLAQIEQKTEITERSVVKDSPVSPDDWDAEHGVKDSVAH